MADPLQGMEDLTDSVVRLLRSDADIVARVAPYGAYPAIYGSPPIPEDAPLPRIIVWPPEEGGAPLDMARTLWRTSRMIVFMGEADGDPRPIEALAERAARLLARRPEPEGCRVLGASPGTVADAPTIGDEDVYARSLAVDYLVETEPLPAVA